MRKLCLFITLIIVSACKHTQDDSYFVISINGPDREYALLSEVLSVDSWIQLEGGENGPVIGQVNTLYPCGDSLYMSDSKGIYVFGKDGHYSRSLMKYGRGPGEYLGIMSFCVSGDYLYLLDQNRKLLKYDSHGDCVLSEELDFYPASVFPFGKEELILTSSYQGPEEKFHVFDAATLQRKRSFHRINEREMTWRHFRGQQNFFIKGDSLLFHEPMDNDILLMTADSSKVSRRLDIHGRSLYRSFTNRTYEDVLAMNIAFTGSSLCAGAPVYAESDSAVLFTFRDGYDYRMCRYEFRTHDSFSFGKILFDGTDSMIPVSEILFGFLSEDDMAMLLNASALEPDVLGAMGVDEDYEGPIVGLCRL
ncbi:MAG: 6-bladed beta-propeller [Candidatus Cryptobacteroides sp.]